MQRVGMSEPPIGLEMICNGFDNQTFPSFYPQNGHRRSCPFEPGLFSSWSLQPGFSDVVLTLPRPPIAPDGVQIEKEKKLLP